MKPLLSVHLNAGYREQQILRDLCFDLYSGDRLGLLGPSGTGKSTLLFALLGLLSHRGGWVKGEVLLDGKNLLKISKKEARRLRGRALALVPQSPLTALNPALSLGTHFELCWSAHRSAKAELQPRVEQLMRRVQLPSTAEFLKRKPGQISVGQAQRATLALALLHRPPVIIADEPTSSLDPVTQVEVLQLMREISEEQGTGILFVSHDLMSVLRLCTEVAVLARGRVAERLAVEDIVLAKSESLQDLLRALPVPPQVLLQHMQPHTALRSGESTPMETLR